MKRWVYISAGLAALMIGGVTFAYSHKDGHMGHGAGHMGAGHGGSNHGGHSGGLHQHDEINMPGLLGRNATAQESAELALMFNNFQTISREVENLPNGIRTVTRSSDRAVMDALINHSVGMIDRVDLKDDPQIAIQSPTLDIFFLRGDEIQSNIDIRDDEIIVIQTSEDPELVAALHTHAAEVTAMVDRGMAAVHEMMMEKGRGH